jgi:hypothetical protein
MDFPNVFKSSSGGSIMEDLFGFEGATLTGYLDSVFNSPETEVVKFFYQQLYRDFSPDINGYTLVFFVPPDLSGYKNLAGSPLYSQEDPASYMSTVGKIMTFAAVDFTPPQSQVRTENVSTRSGSVPIASEVSESETISITFVDNGYLDIYMFHHLWVEYIREILEGTIAPDDSYYYTFKDTNEPIDLDFYGAIDYAASCYIVKYRPDMKTVTYVSKCVGIFPQSLPNKELIGTRSANEIVTLPFTYSCSGFREALYHEKSSKMWIFDELDDIVKMFSSKTESPMFGGFLGGVLNSVIGPTSGALKNLTGNAAKLGGITGDLQNFGKATSTSIQGLAQPDGFSKIFKVNG